MSKNLRKRGLTLTQRQRKRVAAYFHVNAIRIDERQHVLVNHLVWDMAKAKTHSNWVDRGYYPDILRLIDKVDRA